MPKLTDEEYARLMRLASDPDTKISNDGGLSPVDAMKILNPRNATMLEYNELRMVVENRIIEDTHGMVDGWPPDKCAFILQRCETCLAENYEIIKEVGPHEVDKKVNDDFYADLVFRHVLKQKLSA